VDIQPYTSTETLAVGRPWLMSMLGIEANETVTLDLTQFDRDPPLDGGVRTSPSGS
jgi:hypothetical protein